MLKYIEPIVPLLFLWCFTVIGWLFLFLLYELKVVFLFSLFLE